MMDRTLDPGVLAELQVHGVKHLTHFSPSRNLPHILAAGGLLSVASLADMSATFEPTDARRLDNRPDLICCNVDLPNTRYFAVAQRKPNAYNFPDWLIFLVDPRVAARTGTGFAPGNAARRSGREIGEGRPSLERLWARQAAGELRTDDHRPGSPTNVQAEVLVPGRIDLTCILAVVADSKQKVRQERARLLQIGHDPDALPWIVAPDMFDTTAVIRAIRSGTEIPMEHWPEPTEEPNS